MLIRKIMTALVALFVLGVAAPAFAKTNAQVRACVDQSFASAPFTGTLAERELRARNLHAETDTVLIDGVRVAATAPIWKLCEGPTLTEQLATANARADRFERLAYHNMTDGSGRQIRVTWKSTATARGTALEAAKATIAKDALTLKSAYDADSWQFAIIGALLIAFLIACFRTTIVDKLDAMDLALGLWLDRRADDKARKNAKPAPMTPAGPDHVESDERPDWVPGQP